MPPSRPPPALTHATAAAAGTLLSTLLTYPLDLVTTRLKVQRRLPSGTNPKEEEEEEADSSSNLLSALLKIYDDGGPAALYTGLGTDLVKSVLDSFLFFLFYTYLTNHTRSRNRHPLLTGALAGAAAKLVTTPVANVVTRQQLSPPSPGQGGGPSFWERLDALRREGGLWAGYGASLVLTLNPGVTVWLEGVGRGVLGRGGAEGGWRRFLLAAGSKVVATGGMYPLVVGRARVQAGVGGGEGETGEGAVGRVVRDSIFGTVWRIGRTEGVGALYDGLGGEVVKGFFNYGLGMVFKDVVHGVLVRMYVALVVFLRNYPGVRARLVKRMRAAREGVSVVGVKGLRERMGLMSVLGGVISGGEGL
ncbi:mitochondrial carrier domain-containing protein [Podospora conica]|nr:mitochondrial carrier domain-containing protein [Schizothecium conicum]